MKTVKRINLSIIGLTFTTGSVVASNYCSLHFIIHNIWCTCFVFADCLCGGAKRQNRRGAPGNFPVSRWASPPLSTCQLLKMHQLVKVYDSSNKIVGIILTFLESKHYNQRPFTLFWQRQPDSCPIALLLPWISLNLSVRSIQPGAIFTTQHGAPVTRDAFASRLDATIRFCGRDPTRYKGHTFRIGAGYYAAEQGMSDAP